MTNGPACICTHSPEAHSYAGGCVILCPCQAACPPPSRYQPSPRYTRQVIRERLNHNGPARYDIVVVFYTGIWGASDCQIAQRFTIHQDVGPRKADTLIETLRECLDSTYSQGFSAGRATT